MELVKGYIKPKTYTVAESIRLADQEAFKLEETLYAVLHDGRVFTTGLIDASPHFDKKGRKWKLADSMPSDVEFIGDYPTPKGIK
jgi:hypothetical protein